MELTDSAASQQGAEGVALQRLLASTLPFEYPRRLVPPLSWAEHVPFAFYLTELVQPRLFVELGVHIGNSFNAFCQAVDRLRLNCQCYGIDTWKGDPHAGIYVDHILASLDRYVDRNYPQFAQLLQMTFDEGLSRFSDGSIDLLHIDGYHSFEAVSHDFSTWLPKLSNRGVVVLHDTFVRRSDFGVWKFLESLRERYPVINFSYGFGLAVVLVGEHVAAEVRDFVTAFHRDTYLLKYFEALGKGVRSRAECAQLQEQLDSRSGVQSEPALGASTEKIRLKAIARAPSGEHAVISYEVAVSCGITGPFFQAIEGNLEIERITISASRGPACIALGELVLKDINGTVISNVEIAGKSESFGDHYLSLGPSEESIAISLSAPVAIGSISGQIGIIDGRIRPEFNHVTNLISRRLAVERELASKDQEVARLSNLIQSLEERLHTYEQSLLTELEQSQAHRFIAGKVAEWQRPILLLLAELSKVGARVQSHAQLLETLPHRESAQLDSRIIALSNELGRIHETLKMEKGEIANLREVNSGLQELVNELTEKCRSLELDVERLSDSPAEELSSSIDDPAQFREDGSETSLSEEIEVIFSNDGEGDDSDPQVEEPWRPGEGLPVDARNQASASLFHSFRKLVLFLK